MSQTRAIGKGKRQRSKLQCDHLCSQITPLKDQSLRIPQSPTRLWISRLPQSVSTLGAVGGKAFADGVAKGNKIIATYAPVVGQKAVEISKDVKIHAANVVEWSRHNPGLAGCALAGVTGAVLIVVPGIVSAPLLASAGFTAPGVQAGSIGAAAQASIGNVAAGSAFAALQSAGAGGAAGLGIVNGIIQGAGAVMLALSGPLGYIKSRL
ncbi:hypothetical protein ARAM_005305 [Aspergillus rambellii]|uniref:Uncharacterized protein n=1 Tax=Aspergillus rambellii TaxID=308745 RepID=A0A0F8UMT1_9EURO|nr:hypothetical protein ARAM_005305 [Aspergillus rambellii]